MNYPDLLTIQRETRTVDSGGSPITTYADHLTVSSRMQPISANENIKAGRKATTVAYNCYLGAYTSDVLSSDRAVFGGVVLEIEGRYVYPNTFMKLILVQKSD